jgi:hypothetical protein
MVWNLEPEECGTTDVMIVWLQQQTKRDFLSFILPEQFTFEQVDPTVIL